MDEAKDLIEQLDKDLTKLYDEVSAIPKEFARRIKDLLNLN